MIESAAPARASLRASPARNVLDGAQTFFSWEDIGRLMDRLMLPRSSPDAPPDSLAAAPYPDALLPFVPPSYTWSDGSVAMHALQDDDGRAEFCRRLRDGTRGPLSDGAKRWLAHTALRRSKAKRRG